MDQNKEKNQYYFHLKIENKRKALALNVRVNLLNVYKEKADGSLTNKVLNSPLEMHWQYNYIDSNNRPLAQTIGPEKVCDLGVISQDRNFKLRTYPEPPEESTVLLQNKKMKIELIASGDNARSNVLFVTISWDGTFSENTIEMNNHLVIKNS